MMFCLLANSPAQTNKYAYEIGEIAREDVCTPVQLLVIDEKRTDELRKSETPRLPAYFRFNTNAVDDPQARLVAAFATMRELFQAELRSEYGSKTITQEQTREARFTEFKNGFTSRHGAFPLTTELAQQWAMGRAGSAVLLSWDTKLRQTMLLYIRPNNLPPEASYSPQVRILTNRFMAEPVEIDVTEQEGVLVPRKNLVTVAQARETLARKFPANQQPVAAFLAQLLVDNLVYDRKLTELGRAPRVAALWEGDRYTPGQMVVRAGESITPRMKAALDELASIVPPALPAPVPQVVVVPAPGKPPYLFYGSGVLLLLCLICVIVSWRFLFASRKATALVPFPTGLSGRPSLAAADESWLDRALIAEQRARELATGARAALVPKFLQWLKSQGVQSLIAQREELLTTQKLAELELSRLEQMLAEMQAPIAERIKAYEHRISELEQALKAKGEESHELIETMIRLTRQKLEAEREATPGMTWN
jgi:7TM-HD extracellular